MKEIQSQINAGAILDDVQSTENGLTIKLTKNGKQDTYNITNGTDGAKGETGAAGQDGTVWKIGDNGNWWSSEKGGEWRDTGMPSRGERVQLALLVLLVQLELLVGMASTINQMHLPVHSGRLMVRPRRYWYFLCKCQYTYCALDRRCSYTQQCKGCRRWQGCHQLD